MGEITMQTNQERRKSGNHWKIEVIIDDFDEGMKQPCEPNPFEGYRNYWKIGVVDDNDFDEGVRRPYSL